MSRSPGGESSAEYMASQSGEQEEESNTKTETEKDTETMADKIKAGAKALKKKVEDTPKNFKNRIGGGQAKEVKADPWTNGKITRLQLVKYLPSNA